MTAFLEERKEELDSPLPSVPRLEEIEKTVPPTTAAPIVSRTPTMRFSTPDSHHMYQLVLFTTEDVQLNYFCDL